MVEIGVDVQGEAVKTDPVTDPHPDRADLLLAPAAAVDPDPDPPLAPLAADIEAAQRADHPLFEVVDIAAHVGATGTEFQHDIADALPRAVIGLSAAAPGPVDRAPARAQHLPVHGPGTAGPDPRELPPSHQSPPLSPPTRRT